MARKLYIFTTIIFIVVLASFLLISKKIRENNKAVALIATMPEFSFLIERQYLFSNKDIDNTKSRIIINHFNPNCEHCQYMAGEFIKDSLKLKDVQIIMITSADSINTAKFIIDYKLSLLPNIIISRDINNQFLKTFGTAVVPSFFIYEDNKLVKKVIGETIITNLIN